MKIMTNQIENELIKYGIEGQSNLGYDSKIIVKYFNPYGKGTWMITGGEQMENGDWLLFGYADLICIECGYVMLSELESLTLKNGLPLIERDCYLKNNITVREECKRLGIDCDSDE